MKSHTQKELCDPITFDKFQRGYTALDMRVKKGLETTLPDKEVLVQDFMIVSSLERNVRLHDNKISRQELRYVKSVISRLIEVVSLTKSSEGQSIELKLNESLTSEPFTLVKRSLGGFAVSMLQEMATATESEFMKDTIALFEANTAPEKLVTEMCKKVSANKFPRCLEYSEAEMLKQLTRVATKNLPKRFDQAANAIEAAARKVSAPHPNFNTSLNESNTDSFFTIDVMERLT